MRRLRKTVPTVFRIVSHGENLRPAVSSGIMTLATPIGESRGPERRQSVAEAPPVGPHTIGTSERRNHAQVKLDG